VTVFLTTQYMEEADRLCEDIAIMDSGKIVAKGSPTELKSAIGTDAMTLGFASAEEPPKARLALSGFEGIDSMQVAGNQLIIYLKNGAAAVAAVVLAVAEAGLTIRDLRIAQATLDDVFLRATGHHLEVQEKLAAAAAAGGAA
jgi:ABC-2 type transport system ATP-binding protein